MPLELVPVTYVDTKGQPQATTVVRGRPMPRRLEAFCRLVAAGELSPIDAYCQTYEKAITLENGMNIASSVSHMMARTDVILRIQQLRTPVIPKIAEKFEYSLNRALEQCQTVWDLAYAKGNEGAMLKAIEMQSRLSKLLSEQIDVTHKYGFLDDTATENLIRMKQQLEAVQKARKTIDITPKEV